jgi:Kelch motif
MRGSAECQSTLLYESSSRMIIKPAPHSRFGSRWVDRGTGMSLLLLLRDSLGGSTSSDRIVLPVDIIIHSLPQFLRFECQIPGMIYVCGGRCSKVLEPHHYLATAECYDPFRNEWFTLPHMSTRRVGAASIELNGLIYVVGGYCLHPDKPLSTCEG